ncbi:MAG: hypothetical protein ACPGRE_06975 [Flavobacteriaceae bacterium]
MNKHNFIVSLTLILGVLSSCSNKQVQLPLSNFVGVQDTLYDNSQIWIFNQDAQAVMNQKNRISTTDWVLNIDKHLTMEQVYPLLVEVYQKRHKKSMHSNADAINFLSYMNPEYQAVQTLPISHINYENTEKDLPEFKIPSDSLPNFQEDWKLLISKDMTYDGYVKFKSKLIDQSAQTYYLQSSEELVKN